jgi:hypothetical protein
MLSILLGGHGGPPYREIGFFPALKDRAGKANALTG